MKRKFLLLLTVLITGIVGVNAQGGGGQRQTPEERTKATMEKLSPLNLDAETAKKTGLKIKFRLLCQIDL